MIPTSFGFVRNKLVQVSVADYGDGLCFPNIAVFASDQEYLRWLGIMFGHRQVLRYWLPNTSVSIELDSQQ